MFKRVKNWLGIEGVKVELIPEIIDLNDGKLEGKVLLSSIHAQTVTGLHFKIVEKYSRGRGKSKLIDEYLLYEDTVNVLLEIPPQEVVAHPFSIQFEVIKSRVDELSDHNPILRGIGYVAKTLKSVKSEFRVEVEADVIGTALNPFDKKIISS